jgi:integrase
MYETNSGIALKFYGEDYPVKRLNNRELLRFVKHEQGRGVKNVTLVKRIRLIKAVVALAGANHGFAPHTYKIELSDDTADVVPYSADELNQLFSLISSRKIPKWQYWAVLISLLGGLRREEVVSLRIQDVKEYWGIWYFNIVDAKSDAGIRKTPVSDILIKLGFLDFLGERKKSGEKYLFMCWLPVSKHVPKPIYAPVPVTKYGDFFANLRESKMHVELEEGEKKTLHSLRHNYSDALKQAGVRPDIIDELCGHEHAPGSMRSIYDEKFGIGVLSENLEKAVWGCDFSLLKTWKPAD